MTDREKLKELADYIRKNYRAIPNEKTYKIETSKGTVEVYASDDDYTSIEFNNIEFIHTRTGIGVNIKGNILPNLDKFIKDVMDVIKIRKSYVVIINSESKYPYEVSELDGEYYFIEGFDNSVDALMYLRKLEGE